MTSKIKQNYGSSINEMNKYVCLTMDINASQLLLHGAGVDLAHIAAAVALAQLADAQLPRSQVIVGHGDARVVRYHPVVECQDGLVFRLEPAHLEYNKNQINKCCTFLPQVLFK